MRNWIDLFETKTHIRMKETTNIGTFYHGTSSEFTSDIKREGLRPDSERKVFDQHLSSIGGIYLCITKDWATRYAKGACQKYGGDPVVLTIQANWDDLLMDEDTIMMALENMAQDYDDAHEMAVAFKKSYEVSGECPTLDPLCQLVIDEVEVTDPMVRPLLAELVTTVKAQPVSAIYEPDYQVHYMGVIGWAGSPCIVSVDNA